MGLDAMFLSYFFLGVTEFRSSFPPKTDIRGIHNSYALDSLRQPGQEEM